MPRVPNYSDFDRALGYDPADMKWTANPCSEIILDVINQDLPNPNRYSSRYPTPKEFKSMTTFSTADGNRVAKLSTPVQSLDVDFDSAVWKIQLPGVPKENIQVFTVKEKLYVDVTDGERLEFNLALDEKVTSTKLELGVLSVTIDRPNKRESIEIS